MVLSTVTGDRSGTMEVAEGRETEGTTETDKTEEMDETEGTEEMTVTEGATEITVVDVVDVLIPTATTAVVGFTATVD